MKNFAEVNVNALEQALRMLGGENLVALAHVLYNGLDEAEVRGFTEGAQDGYRAGVEVGIQKAERTYEDGHNDGWTNGYVEGVRDARVNPLKADLIVGGMSEKQDADMQLGFALLGYESPEDRNAAAEDSDVPGC